MRKFIGAISVLILLSSCAREVVEPAQQITGRYVLDDGTGLTGEFLEFKKTVLSVYTSGESYPLAEGKIWDNGERNFRQSGSARYSIQDGTLFSGVRSGAIAKDEEDRLTLGTKTYVRLDGFKADPYSIIRPEKVAYELPLQEGAYSFPVTVENPIPAGKLTASSLDTWITGIQLEDGLLRYNVSSTKTPRTGTITLKYTHAKDYSFHAFHPLRKTVCP